MTTVNELRFLQDPSLFITTADIYIYLYIKRTSYLHKWSTNYIVAKYIANKQLQLEAFFFFFVPEMKEKNKKPYHNYK